MHTGSQKLRGGRKVAVPVIDILDPGNFVFCTGTDADLFSD
jgi:hypothetical protein